jgi:hypothetical protein
MRTNIVLWMVLTGGFAAVPVFAHHSFAAEYDHSKPVTLEGVVARVEWQNPHTWIYVDVKEEAGKVVQWTVEAAAPSALIRAGWYKDSLKIGDTVKVEGFLAKDASKTAAARSVILPSGKHVFAGSADQLLFPPQPHASPQK